MDDRGLGSTTFSAWRGELERKLAFGEPDLSAELAEGALMLTEVAGDPAVDFVLGVLQDPGAPAQAKYDAALGAELLAAMHARQPRHEAVRMEPQQTLEVDRERARFLDVVRALPPLVGRLRRRHRTAAGARPARL